MRDPVSTGLLTAGPGQSHEPRTQSGSPMWVAGTQVFELSSVTSQGAISRKLNCKWNSDLNSDMDMGILTTAANARPPTCLPLLRNFKYDDYVCMFGWSFPKSSLSWNGLVVSYNSRGTQSPVELGYMFLGISLVLNSVSVDSQTPVLRPG